MVQITFALDYSTYAGNTSAASAFSAEVRAELAAALNLSLSQVSVSAPVAGSIVTVATLSGVPADTLAEIQAGTLPLTGRLLAQASLSQMLSVQADGDGTASSSTGGASDMYSAASKCSSGAMLLQAVTAMAAILIAALQ